MPDKGVTSKCALWPVYGLYSARANANIVSPPESFCLVREVQQTRPYISLLSETFRVVLGDALSGF